MDLQTIATNIEFSNGIWYSKTRQKVSYPDKGNQDSFALEENSFWFLHRNRCIVSLVKKFSPHSHLFDIGGGNGFVAQALENEGIDTVVVEPGEDGISNAKKRNIKNLICSTLTDAGFNSNSISSMGLFDVLEHVEQDDVFLKDLFKLLAPEGKLYITVPAYQLLWSHEDEVGGHFRRYTMRMLEKKLLSAGFGITYKTYLFSLLPFPIFLLRSLPNRIGLNKKPASLDNHQQAHRNVSIFNKISQWELRLISKLKSIPFGGSCVVVAHKN